MTEKRKRGSIVFSIKVYVGRRVRWDLNPAEFEPNYGPGGLNPTKENTPSLPLQRSKKIARNKQKYAGS
jgi:hypothetical protein